MNCACGHVEDEHEEPKGKRTSTACLIEGCPCLAYEWDGDTNEVGDE